MPTVRTPHPGAAAWERSWMSNGKNTWDIVKWTASHGDVATLHATVPIGGKGRQPVTYSVSFGGTGEVEISAEDAAILIAARSADR
jgi:hypothetical protein